MARRFDEADAAKDKLQALGARVNDREKTWRYQPFVMPDFGPLGHDYTRATDDESDLDEEQLATINRLLAERLEAKLRMVPPWP